MQPSVWLIALALLGAAGCIGQPAGDEADGDVVESGMPAATVIDAGLTDCVELGVARLVSFEHARSLLPPAYEPGEAADFLGMPTPTGGGVVLAGQLACGGSIMEDGPLAWADLLVFTEPPEVPGAGPDRGYANLYQLAEFTQGEATLTMLKGFGFEAPPAEVIVDFEVGPALPVGSATIRDHEADLLRFSVAAGVPQPYDLFARFWHETENGTAFFAHDRSPITMFLGVVTECEAPPGSLHAVAFGVTDCTGGDSMGGVFSELSHFDSTFTFLPGVFAAEADSA